MLTRSELEGALRVWFLASPGDAERLWGEWQKLAASPARLAALDALFDPEQRIGHGWDWWEVRQDGKPTRVGSVTDFDRFRMMLIADPTVPGRPPARPHCPEELVGRWMVTEVSVDEKSVTPPAKPRQYELAADGTYRGAGTTGTWRVHRGASPFLWLFPEDDDGDRQEWRIRTQDGDQLELTPPERSRGFERWRRV